MVSYDLDGRVALVTGAGRGQGRSHVLRYAENGADVVATDVCETTDESTYNLSGQEELAETVELAEACGAEVIGIQMDVTKEADVDAAVGRTLEEFGRIDVLANNAGIATASGLLELDEPTWEATIAVDLKGMWLCSKHVGRHMVERGGGGRIVNTSSAAGLSGAAGLGHYSAAKHGVIGLTKSLAVELAPHGITVNAVCPSTVDTPMTDGIIESIDDELGELAERAGPDNLLDDIITPADVSAAFMWLSSDEARFVTGVALPVAGGSTAV